MLLLTLSPLLLGKLLSRLSVRQGLCTILALSSEAGHKERPRGLTKCHKGSGSVRRARTQRKPKSGKAQTLSPALPPGTLCSAPGADL